MPRVKDFTPVFVKDMEIKLPVRPRGQEGRKRERR